MGGTAGGPAYSRGSRCICCVFRPSTNSGTHPHAPSCTRIANSSVGTCRVQVLGNAGTYLGCDLIKHVSLYERSPATRRPVHEPEFEGWDAGRTLSPTGYEPLYHTSRALGPQDTSPRTSGYDPLDAPSCHWTPTCYSESKFLKVNSPRCVGELTSNVNSRSEIRTKIL